MSTLPTTDDSQPTSARPKVAPTSSPTSPSSRAGPDLGTSILGFLREASNPTLAACLAGLVLAVIVIFGRAGLLLIGALAGAALHAAWAGGGARLGWTKDAAGGATGFDVAKRVLDWQERRTSDMAGHEPVVPSDNRSTSELTFDQFSVSSPHTGAALTGLTAAVMRDYVRYVARTLLVTSWRMLMAAPTVGGMRQFFPPNELSLPPREMPLPLSYSRCRIDCRASGRRTYSLT